MQTVRLRMRMPFLLALWILFAFLSEAEIRADEKSPEDILSIFKPSEIETLVQFQLPSDWLRAPQGTPSDPSLIFWGESNHILIELFGKEGSLYSTAEEFLKSPMAKGYLDDRREIGTVNVMGKPLAFYERKLRLHPPTLEDAWLVPPEEPKITREEFLIVPHGKLFFVLRYGTTNYYAQPESYEENKKIWTAFLQSFRLKQKEG